MNNRWFNYVLLLGMVLILILLTSCGGEAEDEGNKPPIETAQNFYSALCSQPTNSLIGNGTGKNGYVDAQIVIVGDPEKIDEVVSANLGTIFPPSTNPKEPLVKIDSLQVDGREIHIYLYKLDPSISVWEAVDELNTFIRTNTLQNVFAEPNYITILPLYGLGAYASTGAGEISGDPCPGCSGGITGDTSTGGSAVGKAQEYGQTQFQNQWASGGVSDNLGDINLYDAPSTDGTSNWSATWSDPDSNALKVADGSGIQVVVFDSVPSTLNVGHNDIDWASVPFDLCVWKPGLILPPNENSQTNQDEEQIALGEHGLFVTGLAQGVAPDAQFVLIEALNSDARGDVISLLKGMFEYSNNHADLNQTVFNLSLGLEIERYPAIAEPESTLALEKLQELLDQANWIYDEDLNEKFFPAVALKIATKAFEQKGATIVAAAGNDQKEKPQIPAWYSNVLGISSSNLEQDLSCFSNYGDVAAPGGDGSASNNSCDLNLADHCIDYMENNIGACPHVVISIISKNPAATGGQDPGFGFWAGTSMSTPLVSGLAALVLDKCPNTNPETVRCIITNNAVKFSREAGLGDGVIQVKETIDFGCACQTDQ